MKAYLFARLKEASTWRGIIMVLTAAGLPIAPAMADTIVTIGLAVVGRSEEHTFELQSH